MAKMTNDELASKLSNEIESATGNFNTELSEQREQSMKYYLGEPFGNEIEGRSEIVTRYYRIHYAIIDAYIYDSQQHSRV